MATQSSEGAKGRETAVKRSASKKTAATKAVRPAKSAKKVKVAKPAKDASTKSASNKSASTRPMSTKSPPAKKHPIKTPPLPSAVARLRQICLALPETSEELAWGEPTFRVKGKIFAMHASSGNHHGAGRPAVWILSVSLEQDMVIRARPDRYFKPPYVGPSGWIGAWIDNNPPWGEIGELLRDGWRRRAPKKIAAMLVDD